MKIETYDKMLKDKTYTKAIEFIANIFQFSGLSANFILELVDTNDWHCNYKPSVYIHNQRNRFNIRRYSRLNQHTAKLAVKFMERL